MRNEEKQLTRPSLCAKMTQTTVRPGVPVKITLENVRNLKNVTASIYTTNLAGNDDVHVYDAKTFKKFKQNIKNPQMPLTETRQLPYRPNYEQLYAHHRDRSDVLEILVRLYDAKKDYAMVCSPTV